MRKELIISASAVIAMLAMIAPAFAQCGCGIPLGCGFGGPAGCGFGAPFGGCGIGPVGCGCGLPFGIGGCGLDPFSSIVGLGISLISSVLSAAFSCIPLGLGCGIPFGGFC